MKKFKTVTDVDLLYAAHSHYLDIALREQGRADSLKGKNEFSNARAAKAWKRERELHDEICRLEKIEKRKGK